ncbi:MAG: Histidine--tRNA ligase [Parcubacteria group bacterium]|nr:Histidine--tRNA ligase [Parcubacteria group bacterium]
MSTSLRPEDLVKRAAAIGSYYGFSSLASLTSKKTASRAPYPDGVNPETLDPTAREVVGFLKHVRDANLTPPLGQPLFIWHTNAAPGRPAPKQIIIQFHALGTERAIADAVLMRAVRAFMQDLTKDELTLRINSMGDKETRSRFSRELGTFFRKHGPILPEACVTSAKNDVFEAAELLATIDAGSLPAPTDHLSEASRKHFEGVIEYLEASDTAYELAPELLSKGPSWTETAFEIKGGGSLNAWGSRYNELSRPFFSTPMPGVGAVIRITTDVRDTLPALKPASSPRFVFVHIGDEAKRESMKMADTLRKARIPLTQSIGIESLTEQMRQAEITNPPYLLIMGRKEALERSVILRHRASYTETFIPLDSLVDHLKGVA